MHVVRPPRETGLACDAHDMSALSINLGEQYDAEVASGPQDPLTARYRTETLECPNPPGRTQPDHCGAGDGLGEASFLETGQARSPSVQLCTPTRSPVAAAKRPVD
jgi:hypothetical protein